MNFGRIRENAGRVVVMVLAGAVTLLGGFGTSASAASSVEIAAGALAAAPVVECDPGDMKCDIDGDRIPDQVEEVVCGSATCATGREDRDGDGLADWVEMQASGDVTGVDVNDDVDSDGIPDFAETIVCGSARCATGREDVDGDGVGDWAEVVICGDVTCSDGQEDYDGDGVKDATELAACVNYGRGDGWLALTGVRIGLLVVVAGLLVGGGLLVRSRVRRGRAGEAASAL